MDQLEIILLYILGMVAMIVEMFMPGIILGTCGFLACIGAIGLAFYRGETMLGTTLIIVGVIFLPMLVLVWYKIISGPFAVRHTEEGFSAAKPELRSLVGAEGVSITPLRPAGTARINDQRVDVVADGEMIPPNSRIRVIRVDGNRVVVRSVKI
jgi:membrane-bound serine protease (ClpP class)